MFACEILDQQDSSRHTHQHARRHTHTERERETSAANAYLKIRGWRGGIFKFLQLC